VLYNNHLFWLLTAPFSWEGGVGGGYVRREGNGAWAPAVVTLGLLAPPLYAMGGFWRNELGAQVRGYYFLSGDPGEVDGHATLFWRASFETPTVIVRVQAGPTIDFRSGRWGGAAALALTFPSGTWIKGGGPLQSF
jgi:hypothetical protein